MKVYIKKRWVKKRIKAGKYYSIPQNEFKSFGGKVWDADYYPKDKSIFIIGSGWWLPFNKVKLVSR